MTPPDEGAVLDDWLSYLESIHPTEMDLGLDRVLLVLRRLMPSRPASRVITVAGTNGKGSTVVALESLLLAAGETVGCYTSPHLMVYNERVRINGRNVSDDSLIRAFQRVDEARSGVSLTYFEFGTLAAFLVMEEAGVRNMVLEVGLGGRLDAVNVLDADLAIITSVDLDHTAWLGNDRNTIGFEKAGILRPGQLAIYADEDPPASVLQQARAQKVNLQRPGTGYFLETTAGGPVLITDDAEHRVALPPNGLPLYSLAAAAIAMIRLGSPLTDSQIAAVLGSVQLAGRFEKVAREPDVYVDVGHNPHAAGWLARRLADLRQQAPDARVWAVYAGLEDKDSANVAAALAPVVDYWYLAGLAVPRGLSATALASRLHGTVADQNVAVLESVTEAVQAALSKAGTGDILLVFGSFFTVAEARRYFPGTS